MSSSSSANSPKGGFGNYLPPSNIIEDVFPLKIRDGWRERPTEELINRLKVLCACGPAPLDSCRSLECKYWIARKASWDTYLFTAFACGLFHKRGEDLRGRLRGRDADGFRGAMAECIACWFLAGRMHFPLLQEVPGRKRKNLDMGIVLDGSELGVEVKSPFREMPKERAWSGDDSDKIEQAIANANEQFADAQANLLVLVPALRKPLCINRSDLLRAAFGQSRITWQIDLKTGKGGNAETKFFPDGKFLNTKRPGGKPLKPDGLPAYRRISAMIVLEESVRYKHPMPNPALLMNEEIRGQVLTMWDRELALHSSSENEIWMDHDVLILHNPHAYHVISYELFSDYPQLIPDGDKMIWTDNAEIII